MHQTEIVCQSYVPEKIDVPIYPNGARSFGASSPRVRFLDVYGFPLFLNNK